MFFNLPIALGCLTFVLFMELLYSRRRFRPLLLSVPLMLLSTTFALHLYPAFQVPFAFILLTLIDRGLHHPVQVDRYPRKHPN